MDSELRTLAEYVREGRVSRATIARELGVQPRTASAWIDGRRAPQPRFEAGLAELIDRLTVDAVGLRLVASGSNSPSAERSIRRRDPQTAVPGEPASLHSAITARIATGTPLSDGEIQLFSRLLDSVHQLSSTGAARLRAPKQ